MTPDTIRNKDIRLICLDLDGTLLNSSKQLSPRNRRALDEAAARGICIVPATGRLPMGLTQEVRTLPYLRYVISINGALTYDLAENRVLSRFEIPLAGALEILDVLKDYDGIYDCYRDGQGYMNAQMLAAADEFCADTHQLELVRATRVPVPDLAAFLRGAGSGPAAPNTANASADGVPASSGSVQKCQIMFRSRAARDAVLDEITGRLPGYLCTCSYSNNIEINSPEANKGAGLRSLCSHLGIAPDQAMCFGDGSNDIAMLQSAGVGVAMQNADDPAVLAAADLIAPPCDEDGVARIIEDYVLK